MGGGLAFCACGGAPAGFAEPEQRALPLLAHLERNDGFVVEGGAQDLQELRVRQSLPPLFGHLVIATQDAAGRTQAAAHAGKAAGAMIRHGHPAVAKHEEGRWQHRREVVLVLVDQILCAGAQRRLIVAQQLLRRLLLAEELRLICRGRKGW